MLTESQRDKYIAFVANFVWLMRDHSVPLVHAEMLASLAASTLLVMIFEKKPGQDEMLDDFIAAVVKAAIKTQYK